MSERDGTPREALAGLWASGLQLWRRAAGRTAPRPSGRRHCARKVGGRRKGPPAGESLEAAAAAAVGRRITLN